ncbi:MAG: sigma-54 dependent transcriptional regulator [Actinomycetota bacterium]|nr:MAG: two component sigma54 specific Fis family transcriptional [Actinomycetota bacterium]MDO8950149.1 sigma-54 dependent transcriptional regulator [Actinomycetota bacterium]MDP3630470.1 sigma-54 dependent transcriptional regulator [Actinomycetota bacterium]
MKRRVLIADDEKNMRWVLAQALSAEGYEVIEAADGKEALTAVAEQPPDLMVLDHKMPAPDGMEVLRRLRAKGNVFPIIMLTAHGNVTTAVAAMKAGASEYLTKPFDLEELKISIEKALKVSALAAEVERLREELDRDYDVEGIVAADPAMLSVLETIGKVAPTNATVILYGESGTGKELAARALHKMSTRSARPFVSVSAGALPETLLESELFGYEKGAFTGAMQAKPGRFELANGGTIFLDEIGDISLAVQVKLLRVLQERTFERLGGTRTLEVDVRVVAATNQDLQQLIADGAFREDLYYRLNVVPITLPPLRQRPSEIPLLVAHFLEKQSAGSKHISSEAMRLLMEYQWPGNVRELENTIERIAILSRGDEIGAEDLPAEVRSGVSMFAPGERCFVLPEGGVDLEEVELDFVRQGLDRSGGNVPKAAKLLGLTTKTLEARMAKYGL